jgi:hypothetical protein
MRMPFGRVGSSPISSTRELAPVVELVDVQRCESVKQATHRSHTPEAKQSEEGYTTKIHRYDIFAQVVELVDTTVLEAVAVRCKGSSPFLGTIKRFSRNNIFQGIKELYFKLFFIVYSEFKGG